MIENTHMAWLTDQEYLDLVQPESRIGKALHARLERLVTEGSEEVRVLEEKLQMVGDKLKVALSDLDELMEY